MHPAEIAASYDTIAHRWLEPYLESNGIRQHEQALRFCRKHGGLALDVGCGCNGRFARLLASHGYEVEGLDVSARMITLARQRSPTVTFHQADVCEWTPGKRYDFITAWDSIWHVPLARSEDVLRKLLGSLTADGVLGVSKTLQVVSDVGCVCRHLEYDQLPEEHVFLVAQRS